MNNFESTATPLAIIILWIFLWALILFLLYRWAYRRKGILGIILLFLLGPIGALIILLLPPDDKVKK